MNFPHLPFDAWTALPAALLVLGVLAALVLKRKLASPSGSRRKYRDADPAAETRPGETRPLAHFSDMVEVRQQLNPLTEAEVFMALGRDQEAEDLLLDAIRNAPTKISLRVKLAEVYAKRPDPAAFDSVAFKLRLITGSRGPVWESICKMGRSVDPGNPEYRDMQAAADKSAFAVWQPHPEHQDFAETELSELAPLARRAA